MKTRYLIFLCIILTPLYLLSLIYIYTGFRQILVDNIIKDVGNELSDNNKLLDDLFHEDSIIEFNNNNLLYKDIRNQLFQEEITRIHQFGKKEVFCSMQKPFKYSDYVKNDKLVVGIFIKNVWIYTKLDYSLDIFLNLKINRLEVLNEDELKFDNNIIKEKE